MAEHQNDPGSIRAWITYDWANSAYATTILAAVLPAYFAAEVVGDGGVDIIGRNWTGQDLWALAVGAGRVHHGVRPLEVVLREQRDGAADDGVGVVRGCGAVAPGDGGEVLVAHLDGHGAGQQVALGEPLRVFAPRDRVVHPRVIDQFRVADGD